MPVRTCAVCRVRAERGALLRLVRCDGSVVPDLEGTGAGRGAWLHPGCVGAAVARPGALSRAFRGSVQVPADLIARVEAELDRRVAILRVQGARLGIVAELAAGPSRNTSRLRQKMALRLDLR